MTELIQQLWSGYGELLRVDLVDKSLILKLVTIPNELHHPRGWTTTIGHQRKMASYEIERHWYREFHHPLSNAKTAKHHSSGVIENHHYLILEDLKESGFSPKRSLTLTQVKACLAWLAHFHHHYLNVAPIGLWQSGTYWHLQTRPDELAAMTDLELKEAASKIDEKLTSAQYKTIVHGDAKLANVLFNEDEVAAVDFQYVGGGVGVKDLIYFLSSIYDDNDLHQYADECYDFYFKELNHLEAEQEWRALIPYAWCDFYRFLQGWSPGHWKINSYVDRMRKVALL